MIYNIKTLLKHFIFFKPTKSSTTDPHSRSNRMLLSVLSNQGWLCNLVFICQWKYQQKCMWGVNALWRNQCSKGWTLPQAKRCKRQMFLCKLSSYFMAGVFVIPLFTIHHPLLVFFFLSRSLTAFPENQLRATNKARLPVGCITSGLHSPGGSEWTLQKSERK